MSINQERFNLTSNPQIELLKKLEIPQQKPRVTIKESWDRLKQEIQNDPEYAWAVHCNIAMPIMDNSDLDHTAANIAAASIMSHLFGVDIAAMHHERLKN